MTGLGLGLALGGAQLLSSALQQRAAKKERDYYRDMYNKMLSSPEVQSARESYSQLSGYLQGLPGELARTRQSRIASLGHEAFNRLQRNLSMAGATGGSGLASMELRKTLQGLESQSQKGRLAETAQIAGLQGSKINLARKITQMLYPSISQTAPIMGRETVVDPSSAISNALLLSQLLK